LKSSAGEISLHLDEDSLASFAEGTLSKRESAPVISHLVNCGFCRHKTAELVLLDLELSATDERAVPAATTEPSAISKVLNDVLSKIFGTTDQAVFAHNEEDKDESPEGDDPAKKQD
jgi:anti-sigma factor ChrR (cupin superfamily)